MMLRSFTATACAVGVALAATAPAAFAQDWEAASVVNARGGLRGAIAPSTAWEDVAAGARVRAGDTLKTAGGGSAELVFPTGARLALGENTILRLQDLEGLSGRVMAGRVRLTAPPEGLTTMVAGGLRLSGTDAEAVIERAGGAWRVAVLSGTFRVAEAGKQPTSVDAGRSAIFAGGEPRYSVISRAAWQDLTAGFGAEATAAAPAAMGPGANKWVAAGLSALLPGAGQLYAGEVGRGLLYLGAEFALLGTGFYGVFYGQKQMALYAGAGLIGLNLISPLDAVLTTSLTPQPLAGLEPDFPTAGTPAFRP